MYEKLALRKWKRVGYYVVVFRGRIRGGMLGKEKKGGEEGWNLFNG